MSELRRRLAGERAALRREYEADVDAARFLRRHRQSVESSLCELWREARLPRQLALVAVGGFGRGELYPHSDVDVLVLLPHALDPAGIAQVEQFIGRLWDVGLELGHSVRTVEECRDEAAKDVTVQTSLLEARLIAGSRTLFAQLYDRLHDGFDPQAFFKAKRLEQEQRHAKFQDSPYSLEPNLKEAPGGLRDLQVVLWVGRASGLGRDWRSLAARGLVTREEAIQLKRHADWLARVRIRLHLLAGRREDRILFDYQDALARAFGFVATPTKRASELFMQRYFRTAKAVTQLNTTVLQNLGAAIFPAFDAPPEPINGRFQAVRELLDVRDAGLFER
jgi:[protein-PII] uridylyltransferase